MAQILLIDDDDSLRRALRLILIRFGHAVMEARDGKEGMALFSQAHVDLVITDIVMPEKDGLAVLAELQKKQPRVKIIAISGGGRFSSEDYLHIAKIMGAAKVLPKPFSNEVLISSISELLDAGRDVLAHSSITQLR